METIQFFIVVFVLASLLALFANRMQLPLTPLLLVFGLAVGAIPGLPDVHITSETILFVFLPPLLFEAAFSLNLEAAWNTRHNMLVLAVPGVLLATGIVGLLIYQFGNLPWAEALLFGAIVSATDPVAVIAIFRQLNASQRLSTLLEGESLLNDGVALVLVAALIEAVRGDVSPLHVTGLFVYTLIGGIVIGAICGVVGHRLIGLTAEHQIELALSLAVAYGAFLLADELKVSPVFATLTAAVVIGQFARDQSDAFSAQFQILVHDVWGLLAFLANAALFVLLGLEMRIEVLDNYWPEIAAAIVAALVSRAAVAYGLNRFAYKLSFGERTVLFWGGLRGAVALAAVLSLPADFPYRDRLFAMTAGVVIFTVVVQGSTIGYLVRRLGVIHRPQTSLP